MAVDTVVDSAVVDELSDATSEELVLTDSAVLVLVTNVVALSDTNSEELVLIDSAEVVTEVDKVAKDVVSLVDWTVSEDSTEMLVDALEDSVAVDDADKDVYVVSEEVVREASATVEDAVKISLMLYCLFATIKLTQPRHAHTSSRKVSAEEAKGQRNRNARTHYEVTQLTRDGTNKRT
jgi:hypothetical protein